MSDTKNHRFRPPLYHSEARDDEPDDTSEAGREQKGWDAYRKWLSSMSSKPRSRRAPIDHSVYSWKGYHTWADRIRQNWKSEDN